MTNILFLDDSYFRRMAFIKKFPECKLALTAPMAIKMLQEEPEWDLVSLDHDLGGQVFVDSNREDCGMEVVRWIVANSPKILNIRIHSWNPPAADRMMDALAAAGYRVWKEAFEV